MSSGKRSKFIISPGMFFAGVSRVSCNDGQIINLAEQWSKKKTYRVSGDYYPANQVICFDLNKPCEIVDGKVAAAETV